MFEFSPLGFGCASLWASPWLSHARADALLSAALDAGINYFDTGASYGCGRAERRLGQTLQRVDRSRLILSSKAGTHCAGVQKRKDFSARAVRRSLDESLRRLGTEHLDILYLHGPEMCDLSDELLHTLAQCKRDGLVRQVGINSFNETFIRASIRHDVFAVYMIECNILNAGNLALAEWLKQHGKCVIAGSALGRAMYDRSRWQLQRPANLWYWLRALKSGRRDLLRKRRDHFHGTQHPVRQAIEFVCSQAALDCAVFSSTRAEHIASNMRWAQACAATRRGGG